MTLYGTDVEVTANIAGNMTYMELISRSQLTLLVCMTLFGINVEVTANIAGRYDLIWNCCLGHS